MIYSDLTIEELYKTVYGLTSLHFFPRFWFIRLVFLFIYLILQGVSFTTLLHLWASPDSQTNHFLTGLDLMTLFWGEKGGAIDATSIQIRAFIFRISNQDI